jgi:hypothetical protein
VNKIKTQFLSYIYFSENGVFFLDNVKKNMVESDKIQVTIRYGACALHAG